MDSVWTVGHSTRSLDELVTVLEAYRIELVVDVRRFPGSRRLPQFNSAELEAGLAASGIAYKWLPSLGGRRAPYPQSLNSGWTNAAFRGYADHTASEEFADGLFELLNMSNAVPSAVMCAEVLWWRCHRRIIADVLVSLGIEVIHVCDGSHSELHKISAPGRIADGALTYAPELQQPAMF